MAPSVPVWSDEGMDPTSTTARSLAAAIKDRSISATEALEAHLARIDAVNPIVNAVVTWDTDRAIARAAAADAATAHGESWGPLHGVPMTVKDVWETAGMRTTCGAPEFADHVPDHDAVAVASLRSAGAVIFGKTNTPLYAGDVQTYNELFGVTNNPWDLTRTTGGSSGGAAAAVATSMTPFELGSDIGGSIRNPAHYCGVYGFKPTWGLIPTRGHIPGPPGTLVDTDVNCAGPLARSVDDLSLAFDVLAGADPLHSSAWSLTLPPARPHRDVSGLRIALVLDDTGFPTSSATRSRLRAAADALTDAGALVEEQALPVTMDEMYRSWQALVLPVIGSGLPDDLYDAFAAISADQSDDAAGRASAALVSTWRTWRRATQRRALQRLRWADHFERWDLVMTPVMPVPAFPHDVETPMPMRTYDIDGTSHSHLELVAWCGAIGAMLLPVVALPLGLSTGSTPTAPIGMPIGAQLIAADSTDLDLLAMAAAVDEVIGGYVPWSPTSLPA